jgi:hypothetical protein
MKQAAVLTFADAVDNRGIRHRSYCNDKDPGRGMPDPPLKKRSFFRHPVRQKQKKQQHPAIPASFSIPQDNPGQGGRSAGKKRRGKRTAIPEDRPFLGYFPIAGDFRSKIIPISVPFCSLFILGVELRDHVSDQNDIRCCQNPAVRDDDAVSGNIKNIRVDAVGNNTGHRLAFDIDDKIDDFSDIDSGIGVDIKTKVRSKFRKHKPITLCKLI